MATAVVSSHPFSALLDHPQIRQTVSIAQAGEAEWVLNPGPNDSGVLVLRQATCLFVSMKNAWMQNSRTVKKE